MGIPRTADGRPNLAAPPPRVAGGRLFGEMDGRGAQPLVAISESEFTGLDYGLGVQFIDGGLYVKHVSGNYRFERSR